MSCFDDREITNEILFRGSNADLQENKDFHA